MMKQYRLFFSWQNDRRDVKNIISSALTKAVRQFAEEGIELVIDQDTRGRVGKRNIATEVLDKICSCDIFLADLTPITTYLPTAQNGLPKHMPNSNVMYEYGYALHAKGENRMIALASIDNERGEHIEHMPFDINHDTITTFKTKSDLSGLYLWIKKIMEHVDMERTAHIPEYECSLCFLSEEGTTDEITISPRYEKIAYIPEGFTRTEQEATPSAIPNWLDAMTSIRETYARISSPVVPKLNLASRTINHSYVPIQLVFSNKGTEPLDNLKVQISANDGRIFFADTNAEDTFPFATIKSINDTYVTEDMIVQKAITVNPHDSLLFSHIYIYAPHDIDTFTLRWTMTSRTFRTDGVLTIHVVPQYEIDYRENNYLAGTEKIQDYIKEEY